MSAADPHPPGCVRVARPRTCLWNYKRLDGQEVRVLRAQRGSVTWYVAEFDGEEWLLVEEELRVPVWDAELGLIMGEIAHG